MEPPRRKERNWLVVFTRARQHLVTGALNHHENKNNTDIGKSGAVRSESMPIELQIIRAHEFIRVGAQGKVDVAGSKEVLAELAAACRKRGVHRAMLDLRALRPGPKPVFSTNDLVAVVKTFRDIGFTRADKLAVLYFSDPHHRAREFAFISRWRGWNVRAFETFEEAFAWLALTDSPKAASAAELEAGATVIPLRPAGKTRLRKTEVGKGDSVVDLRPAGKTRPRNTAK